MMVKFDTEAMRLISLFESITGVCPIDFMECDGTYIFLLRKDDMGLAIGRERRTIKIVERMMKRKVRVVEYSEDPETFIRNLFSPIEIRGISIVEKDGKRIAYVEVRPDQRVMAIGRNGRRIEGINALIRRHHELERVVVR